MTFTILSGGNPVGSPVSPNVTETWPARLTICSTGTPGGSYTIQAVYSDPDNFTTSTGTNQLSVTAAATNDSRSQPRRFQRDPGRRDDAFRNVSSSAGTINEGSVTFTDPMAQHKSPDPSLCPSRTAWPAVTSFFPPVP